MQFTPVILIHIFAASGAVLAGGLALALKKGTTLHRFLGRIWVALMLVTALGSFAIRSNGHLSWIHLLSVLALAGLGASLFAVARGRIQAHRRGMRYTYIGLVIAGVFTLLPDRRLGYLVWHSAGLI
ncbi:DUF2306 domain-containing protein [Noviherbaspirillum aerium]|uniref:DUF2306 domain-containing protein n=1 Tax=Noviherbaspirillum aerium TaxID=2588497 RepID=UPI00124D5E60|nr:DUF2306 domain-containing protein [Noviherbaspirillum aerium]